MLWRGASMREVQGVETYKTMLESAIGGVFSEMKLKILDVVASGVNTGPYMG